MAYRRKQAGITRATTFKEEVYQSNNGSSNNEHDDYDDDDDGDDDDPKNNNSSNREGGNGSSSSSLAARAMRASAAHRDSSAYGYAYSSSSSFPSKSCYQSDNNSPIKDTNDSKYGFWGILATKAKSILQEDDDLHSYNNRIKSQQLNYNDPTSAVQSSEGGSRMDNARLRKRLDAITSSLNHLGDTIGNAFEEGRTMVEHKTAGIIQETRNKTADILQETRNMQIRRRGGSSDDTQDQATVIHNTSWQRPVIQPVQTYGQANQDTQLKASRDVAMATAAKAKVLLRELKTVKADLAFSKERCAQLEEENKRLRESREKGDNPADDDLIRLQLETLLAEKARLAHENSIYARENRFLREIVEYHQLTMQDVVYLDEGAEEVTEVYPFSIGDGKVLSSSPTSPKSPISLEEVSSISLPLEIKKEAATEAPTDDHEIENFPSWPPEVSPPTSEKKEFTQVSSSS